jgi:uncharacterized protein YjbI with pentapeptide repeats
MGAWVIEIAAIALSAGVPYALGNYAKTHFDEQPVPLNPVLASTEEAIAATLAIPANERATAVSPLTNLFWSAALVAPVAIGGLQLYLLATTGRTSAKHWLGLQVMTAQGRSPGIVRIALREGVGRWGIPVGLAYAAWRYSGAFPEVRILAGLVGVLMAGDHVLALFDPQRRTFHDRLAGTYVLDATDAALTAGTTRRSRPAVPPPAPIFSSGDRPPIARNPHTSDIIVSPSTIWQRRGLWYWVQAHPGATLVTVVVSGVVLLLGTFAATQVYVQRQASLRATQEQNNALLMSLVSKYSENAPDERRGAILALGSVQDPNPEILLLVNLLGQEDNPNLIEALHQALASQGAAALPYLQRLNRSLKTDLDILSRSNNTREKNLVALRLRSTQRAITKILRIDPDSARTGDLSRTYLAQVQQGVAQFTFSLPGADLAGINFRSADLSGADLRGSLFYGAGQDARLGTFDDPIADFSGANLSQANLANATLANVSLERTNLMKTQLTNANLSYGRMRGANLSGAKLVGSNLEGVLLQEASLTGADLTNATLDHANLFGAKLGQAKLTGARLALADLGQSSWDGADLSGADLTRTNLTEADLRSVNLTGAKLRGAQVQNANMQAVNLTEADVRGVDFTGVDLKGAVFAQTQSSGSGEFVQRADATEPSAQVEGADFRQAENLDDRQIAYICAQGGIYLTCP